MVVIQGPCRDGETTASVHIRRDIGAAFNNNDDENDAGASMYIEVDQRESATANHQADNQSLSTSTAESSTYPDVVALQLVLQTETRIPIVDAFGPSVFRRSRTWNFDVRAIDEPRDRTYIVELTARRYHLREEADVFTAK